MLQLIGLLVDPIRLAYEFSFGHTIQDLCPGAIMTRGLQSNNGWSLRIPTKKITDSELKKITESPGGAGKSIVRRVIVMGQGKGAIISFPPGFWPELLAQNLREHAIDAPSCLLAWPDTASS